MIHFKLLKVTLIDCKSYKGKSTEVGQKLSPAACGSRPYSKCARSLRV